jgi:hypothetical protein
MDDDQQNLIPSNIYLIGTQDSHPREFNISDLESRLQTLVNHYLNPRPDRPSIEQQQNSSSSSHHIQPFTNVDTHIPQSEIKTFCENYRENKKKFNEISNIMNKINEEKLNLESYLDNVKQNLHNMCKFNTDDSTKICMSSISEQVMTLYNSSKEIICKNEEQVKKQYEELCNFLSESISLFKTVENNVEGKKDVPTTSISCPICYERSVNYVYVPCGHTLCGECYKQVRTFSCIVCRKNANAIPFFLSI